MLGKPKQKKNAFINRANLVGRGWIPAIIDIYIEPTKTLLTKKGKVDYYALDTVIQIEKFLNRTQIKWNV